jgi:ATP-binding protein involved in chromosome partitioning
MKTALVDADIFGPSIPKMLGIEDAQPEVTSNGDRELIYPIEKFGIKIISIGFFIKLRQSLIWRGPMAAKALTQLFEDTQWGETDYMIIDFPPGTSDIQLTTTQRLNLTGAIIVTTPQDISLNDARKASSMFMNPELRVPLLGVVENMAWFTPAKHPDEHYYLFGRGGGMKLAKEFETRLLCQIPLVMEVGEAAEAGRNIFQQSDKTAVEAFETLADQIIQATE